MEGDERTYGRELKMCAENKGMKSMVGVEDRRWRVEGDGDDEEQRIKEGEWRREDTGH